MFKQTDYPTENAIRGKFDFRISFMPIADASDFRVQMNESMTQMLKDQITNDINSRIEKSKDDLIDRAKDAVSRMIETLKVPDKGFHGTMIGNIEELSELLPKMNFMNDTHINDVSTMLKTLVVNEDMLKNNKSFRNEIYVKAKEILSKL